MKKKVILSSIVTIALCLSLITGSTFALFTSGGKVDVAVEAGKVNLTATVEDFSVMSFDDYTDDDTFENGGTATLDGNKITLTYMTPGDAVKMTLNSENTSNVKIKYKVRLVATGDLAPALTVKIGDVTYTLAADTDAIVTDWTLLDVVNGTPEQIGEIPVVISFPDSTEDQNGYQGKTADFYIQLIAVQANGTEIYDANN